MRPFRFGRTLLVAAGLALLPEAAGAQIFTPTFMAPRSGSSAGVYLSDFDGGDLAVEGIVRSRFGGFDMGFRGGVVDVGGADVTLGAELRNPFILGTAPVDLAFTAGIQAMIGEADYLGVQGGLSIGHTLVPGNFSVTPFIHPRIALIDYPFSDDMELDVLAEIGADFDFASRLSLRLAVGLDDWAPDWGIGIAWR